MLKLVVFASGCGLSLLVSMNIFVKAHMCICQLNGFKDGDDDYDKAQKLSTMLGKLATEYKQQAHTQSDIR